MTTTPPADGGSPELSPAQQRLVELWEEHIKHEFATRSAADTMETMVEDPSVNHVPVLTGGVGREQVEAFYRTIFIPQSPPDWETIPISRTVGTDQLVDEMIIRFTHTIWMEWMLPGVPPTGKPIEAAFVAVVGFRDDKVAHERIYWDQASVLAQLGLLDSASLPVAGAESARKVLDPSRPSNALIERARGVS
jgi:carboxymethylenebutenolidase